MNSLNFSVIPRVFRWISVMNSLAVLFILGVYGYGGYFSRYVGDDYCETVYIQTSDGLWSATVNGYNTWLNSYSILSFVYLSDLFGMAGTQFFPAFILLVWCLSMIWLFRELDQALVLGFGISTAIWLGGLVIFLSLFQTPVLFQILYWRTGSIPYSFPLAFFVSGTAFLLWYIRQPYNRTRAFLSGAGLFGWVVFASGLGETTSALQVGIYVAFLLVLWLTWRENPRRDVLFMLAAALIGTVGSLLIITISPGTMARLDVVSAQSEPIYNPFVLGLHVAWYVLQFFWDALKVAPLPNLVGFLVPVAVFFYWGTGRSINVSTAGLRRAVWVVPVCIFIVVGFSFAPSAFVDTYPVARARFAGQFVMMLGLFLEGGVLGLLLSRGRLPVDSQLMQALALAFLALTALYPLRSFERVYAPIPAYQTWSAAWDERDVSIRAAIAAGATDLSVVQLDSIGDVIEYKGDPQHWVNLCAAQYYGLNSLVAP